MTEKVVFDFLINRQSGTAMSVGVDEIQADISSILGDCVGNVYVVDGSDVSSATKHWLSEHSGHGHSLIVGGGDGTLLSVAEETAGKNVQLGVLPLGTQNFLSSQSGFSTDYKEALEQYKSIEPYSVQAGNVNGMSFLHGCVVDPSSISFYRAREDLRHGRYFGFLKHAFKTAALHLFGKKRQYQVRTQLDGTQPVDVTISTRLLAFTNNSLSPKPSLGKVSWRRHIRDVVSNAFGKEKPDGVIALYAYQGGVINGLTSLVKIWNATWETHSAISTVKGSSLSLDIVERSAADDRGVTIVLDGELKETAYPLDVSMNQEPINLYRYAP